MTDPTVSLAAAQTALHAALEAWAGRPLHAFTATADEGRSWIGFSHPTGPIDACVVASVEEDTECPGCVVRLFRDAHMQQPEVIATGATLELAMLAAVGT
jgi:hypothetical protein